MIPFARAIQKSWLECGILHLSFLFLSPWLEVYVLCDHNCEPETWPDFDGGLDLQISLCGFHAELGELLSKTGGYGLLGVGAAISSEVTGVASVSRVFGKPSV